MGSEGARVEGKSIGMKKEMKEKRVCERKHRGKGSGRKGKHLGKGNKEPQTALTLDQ